MDYIKIIDAIGDTMNKGGAPLTDDQKPLLVGALAVWLEHAFKAGMDESSSAPACSTAWAAEPPTESGDYWWWNGDENGPPILVSIGMSYNAGTPRLFAEPGQHGWNRYQWADEMGGHWMVAIIPEPPKQ